MMAFVLLSQPFYMVLVELPVSRDRCLNPLATFATWEQLAAILSAGAMFLSWGYGRNAPPRPIVDIFGLQMWCQVLIPAGLQLHLQAAVDITGDDCQHFLCTLKLGGGTHSGGAPNSFSCVWCGKTLLGDGVRQGFDSAAQWNSDL